MPGSTTGDSGEADDRAKGLRYVARVERAAPKIAAPTDTPLWPVEQVGVVGAGTMGQGIAMAFADADSHLRG